MAGSVKLFQTIQKCYHTMGIHSPQPSQSNQKLQFIKMSLFISYITIFFMFHVSFIVFEATSLVQFESSLCDSSTELGILIIYLLTNWRIAHILRFIEMCERFIEKSKSIRMRMIVFPKKLISLFF